MVKVNFFSPGTFFTEVTTKELPERDIEQAAQLAKTIVERYGAIPYAFKFGTESTNYFLNGKIRSKEEVFTDNLPEEDILRSNMEANDIDFVIENTNSWKVMPIFRPGIDVVLEWDVPERGS